MRVANGSSSEKDHLFEGVEIDRQMHCVQWRVGWVYVCYEVGLIDGFVILS